MLCTRAYLPRISRCTKVFASPTDQPRSSAAASSFRRSGPAGLELHHHALAPVAALPVLETLSAVHVLADLTLGLGEVVHDYLAAA